MIRQISVMFITIVVLWGFISTPQATGIERRVLTTQEIARLARESTFVVETVTNDATSSGTAFVVGPGLLATNNHVIEDALIISVRKVGQAEKIPIFGVVTCDNKNDLALLYSSKVSAPALTLSRESLSVGDRVYTIGNPEGVDGSFSEGLVGSFPTNPKTKEKDIQTSLNTAAGSSGGPVLNAYGEVIGIHRSVRGENGNLRFEIPASFLQKLLDSIRLTVSPVPNSRFDEANLSRLFESGVSSMHSGDYPKASKAFENAAIEALNEKPNPSIQAIACLRHMGDCHAAMSNPLRAMRYYFFAQELAKDLEIDPNSEEPYVLLGLAKSRESLGETDPAMAYAERCIGCTNVKPSTKIRALQILTNGLLSRKNISEVKRLVQKHGDVLSEVSSDTATFLHSLGMNLAAYGFYSESIEYLQRARDEYFKLGDEKYYSERRKILLSVAFCYQRLRKYKEATNCIAAVSSEDQTIRNHQFIVEDTICLANLLSQEKRFNEALSLLEGTIRSSQSTKDLANLATAKAACLMKLAQLKEARTALAIAFNNNGLLDDKFSLAQAYCLEAEVNLASKMTKEAQVSLSKATPIFKQLGKVNNVQLQLCWGRYYLALSKIAEAKKIFEQVNIALDAKPSQFDLFQAHLFYTSYAQVLQKLGSTKSAQNMRHKAKLLWPTIPDSNKS